MSLKRIITTGGVLGALLVLAAASTVASAEAPLRTYRVTITNITDSQPMSPGVVITHRPTFELFEVGDLAHPGVEAIAESGNEAPAVAALDGAAGVTDLYDLNRPLTRQGTVHMAFTDSTTFEIEARPGDRISLATMLICTNDGFSGLDGAHLPAHGSVTYHAAGYDAGTEDNTEQSTDMVDPCSGLGSVALAGDPDGNDDAGVDTDPHQPISHHAGINGNGELSGTDHGWDDPVLMVKIDRIS